MHNNRVISKSDAAKLFPAEFADKVELHYVNIFPFEVEPTTSLLGRFVVATDEGDTLADVLVNESSRTLLDTNLAYVARADDVEGLDDSTIEAFLSGVSTTFPASEASSGGSLVEGYTAHGLDGFVPVRVVEDYHDDELVLEQAAAEFMEAVAEGDAKVGGLLGHMVQFSTHPLGRRMQLVRDAYKTYETQRSRMVLQRVLTGLGLGKINGLDMGALGALTDDQFASVLGGLRAAYSSSVTSGALYYLVEKGTTKETFGAWYDQVVSGHDWDTAYVDFAAYTVPATGQNLTGDLMRTATNDPAGFLLDNLYRLDHSAQLTASCLTPGSALVEAMVAREDEVSSGVQRLQAAFAAGESSDDLELVEVMRDLPQFARVALFRLHDGSQTWLLEILRNVSGQ